MMAAGCARAAISQGPIACRLQNDITDAFPVLSLTITQQNAFWEKAVFTGDSGQNRRIRVVGNAKADREREFERLYLESYGLVYGYVRARMSDDMTAEDVVAEAYLKAAAAFDRFDPARSKFSTWVVTIARNCMISHFRKTRPSAALEDVPDTLVAVDGGQDSVDDRDLALKLLGVLDDAECQIVLMKYQDGMKNVEIASELGMNASTVATKLANALAKMRKAAGRSA